MTLHSAFNLLLLALIVAFPILLEANKRHFRGKKPALNSLLKQWRRVHPWIGVLLVVSGALHGYNKLGGKLQFHTGSTVLLALILTGVLGFSFKKIKRRPWSHAHRISGILVLLLLLWHYLFPWAL